MLEFITPNPLESVETLIPSVLPWLHEACGLYYDWLLGSQALADEHLSRMLRDSQSEFSIGTVEILMFDGQPAGGFISYSGEELARRCKVHTLQLLKTGRSQLRRSIMERISQIRNHGLGVDNCDYYLRVLGVMREFRGRGFGRVMMDRYLEKGFQLGYRRFRLHVESTNQAALRLYSSMSFQIQDTIEYPGLGMKLISEVLLR